MTWLLTSLLTLVQLSLAASSASLMVACPNRNSAQHTNIETNVDDNENNLEGITDNVESIGSGQSTDQDVVSGSLDSAEGSGGMESGEGTTTVTTIVVAPPDIFATMAGEGFAAQGDTDFADYLPLPLRSDGHVGHFSRGDQAVSVATVTYIEPVFADPHHAWIEERMALLPTSHEGVVRMGATVIHIVASDADTLDDVVALFSAEAHTTPAPAEAPSTQ